MTKWADFGEDSWVLVTIFGLCIAMGIVMGICLGYGIWMHPSLSQTTMNEICFNFTNVNGTIANVTSDGRLICEKPSFDSTQNIIISSNGDGLR